MQATPRVREKSARVAEENVGISIITAMELQYGLAKNPGAARSRAAIEEFLAD